MIKEIYGVAIDTEQAKKLSSAHHAGYFAHLKGKDKASALKQLTDALTEQAAGELLDDKGKKVIDLPKETIEPGKPPKADKVKP